MPGIGGCFGRMVSAIEDCVWLWHVSKGVLLFIFCTVMLDFSCVCASVVVYSSTRFEFAARFLHQNGNWFIREVPPWAGVSVTFLDCSGRGAHGAPYMVRHRCGSIGVHRDRAQLLWGGLICGEVVVPGYLENQVWHNSRDARKMDTMDVRLTITEAALKVGVSTKTIVRWEKAGRISRPKRNWRGWRVFTEQQVCEMLKIREDLS